MISKNDEGRYERLAANEEAAGGRSAAGDSLHGAEAASAGEALLVQALGSEGAVERAVNGGRPRLDGGRRTGEPSPILQIRVTPERKQRLEELRLQMHKKSTSELVRVAIDEYLDRHPASA